MLLKIHELLTSIIKLDKSRLTSSEKKKQNNVYFFFCSVCRIYEPGKEKGFGQSLLHDGQLVFHTPPYSLQDVLLQDVCYSSMGLKAPFIQDNNYGSKIGVERSRSVMDQNRDLNVDENGSARLSTASASPIAGAGDRKPLGRRFSYTSMR